MRESLSSLTACAGAGGGAHVRARAVCAHAALKLAARLLRAHERRGERTAALAVSTSYLYSNIISFLTFFKNNIPH